MAAARPTKRVRSPAPHQLATYDRCRSERVDAVARDAHGQQGGERHETVRWKSLTPGQRREQDDQDSRALGWLQSPSRAGGGRAPDDSQANAVEKPEEQPHTGGQREPFESHDGVSRVRPPAPIRNRRPRQTTVSPKKEVSQSSVPSRSRIGTSRRNRRIDRSCRHCSARNQPAPRRIPIVERAMLQPKPDPPAARSRSSAGGCALGEDQTGVSPRARCSNAQIPSFLPGPQIRETSSGETISTTSCATSTR